MRIRKRFPTPSSPPPSPPPPPPLAPSTPPHISSITDSFHHHVDEEAPPAPLSQTAPPSSCNPPITEEHLEPSPSSRSDLQLILVKGSNGWVCKTDGDCMHPNSTQLKEESSSLDAHTVHLSLSSSMGSFGAKEGHGIIASTSSNQQDGDNETTMVEGAMKKKRKKADKDSVMTEGARCSRVNGRGWRCCQPTLVGYSLCEHHTSKGRIRSSATTACIDKAKDEKVGSSLSSSLSPSLSLSPSSSSITVNEEPLMKTSVHEEPLMKTIMKRKKKGGMGKARSMSSILGQTQPQCTPPLPIHSVDSVTGL